MSISYLAPIFLLILFSPKTLGNLRDGGQMEKVGRKYNIPLLFGTVEPGLLYNAKLDAPIWGKNLFKDVEVHEEPTVHVDAEIFTEYSILERLDHFSIDASISLSFMAGLIKVEGSAGYLEDDVRSDETVRVTSKYNRRSRSKTIGFNMETDPMACVFSDATHVISEVTYGFNSYFVFEKSVSNLTSKRDIEGSLHIFVDKIPGMTIDGEGNLEMDEEETNFAESISIIYRGDGDIEPPPTTYAEAVMAIKNIPTTARENERVVSFSISPLTDFCDDSERYLVELYEADMRDVGTVLNNYNLVDQFLKKLINSVFSTEFTMAYGSMLRDLNTRKNGHADKFKKELREILPMIRSGNHTRERLGELLAENRASPFYKDNFMSLLNVRQKEVETIQAIIYHPELPDGVQRILDNSGDSNACLMEKTVAVVYELDILPENPEDLGEQYENNSYVDESSKWFMDIHKVQQNQPLLADFMSFSRNNIEQDVCFLISLNKCDPANEDRPFGFKLFQDGKDQPFETPGKVVQMQEVMRGHNNYVLAAIFDKDVFIGDDDLEAVLEVQYFAIGQIGVEQIEQFQLTANASSLEFELQNLTPYTLYSMTTAIWIKKGHHFYIGRGMEYSNYIMTRPKPPQDLDVRASSDQKIVITWQPPIEVPENNTIMLYNVYVTSCSEDSNCRERSVVQMDSEELTYEFPDDPEDVFYEVAVNYELEFSFIYDEEIEFHGASTNCSTNYDQNNIYVDDHEIIGKVNVSEGYDVYKMKRPWGKFYWISADVTISDNTPDDQPANIFSFCVNECGPEETLLSIDWGQMLIFSGDMPESSFNYNQVAFKGQTSHIYIKQIQTEGNSKHLEIFFDGFLVQALRLDDVVDHDGLVVYASRPNQLSFTDFGILENLKWGTK